MTDAQNANARPRLPSRGSTRAEQRHATWLALGGLVGMGLGFAVLITAVMTGFAPAGVIIVLLIVGMVGLFFGGHYLIWGIWLDRRLISKGDAGPVEFWKHSPPPVSAPDDDPSRE